MSDQRILLLTASIGSGHIKAAEAIEEEIRKLTLELFYNKFMKIAR